MLKQFQIERQTIDNEYVVEILSPDGILLKQVELLADDKKSSSKKENSKEGDAEDNKWIKIQMPHKGMSPVGEIVLSQGVEIDNLRLYMSIEAEPQKRIWLEDLHQTSKATNNSESETLSKEEVKEEE